MEMKMTLKVLENQLKLRKRLIITIMKAPVVTVIMEMLDIASVLK